MISNTELTTLSDEERALFGDPADWEEVESPTQDFQVTRQPTAQFSLRIDRAQLSQLRAVGDRTGMTFSEVAREAITTYLAGATTHRNNQMVTRTLRQTLSDTGSDAIPIAL